MTRYILELYTDKRMQSFDLYQKFPLDNAPFTIIPLHAM